jgi:hypothetical protein
MSNWGKLKRDPEFQQWIESKGWQEYAPLQPGQRVRATQEIYWSETSSRCVDENTLGRVIRQSEHRPGEYVVKWDNMRGQWSCVYNPKASIEEDGHSFDTEIMPVDEPDPTQDPRQYTATIFNGDE